MVRGPARPGDEVMLLAVYGVFDSKTWSSATLASL